MVMEGISLGIFKLYYVTDLRQCVLLWPKNSLILRIKLEHFLFDRSHHYRVNGRTTLQKPPYEISYQDVGSAVASFPLNCLSNSQQCSVRSGGGGGEDAGTTCQGLAAQNGPRDPTVLGIVLFF